MEKNPYSKHEEGITCLKKRLVKHWDEDERNLFIKNIENYGKHPTLISKKMKTRNKASVQSRCMTVIKQIEKNPKMLEAKLLETLKQPGVNPRNWTLEEKKRFMEAHEKYGEDYVKMARYIKTRDWMQVRNLRKNLDKRMKDSPGMPMTHFLTLEPIINRERNKWTADDEK